jgi:hypothetical protein
MHILILILATWRISSLLATEPGPWDVFGKLRTLVGVVYDVNGEAHGTNVVGKAIICVWCNSLYIGAAWAPAWWLAPTAATLVALPFALSAGAVIVNEVVEWLERRS